MRSLLEPEEPAAPDPWAPRLGIRRVILELKAEYPPLSLRQIATICEHRFDQPVSHHTVKQVLAFEPLPLNPPLRLPRYRAIPDSVARRKAIVDLYLEGRGSTSVAGNLETTCTRAYETLARWEAEAGRDWPTARGRPQTTSVPRHRHFAHGGDGGRAPRETGPEELLERVHVVGLNDVEHRVLGVGPVPPDQLDALHVGIEQGVRPSLVPRAELRSVDLRDVKEHPKPPRDRCLRGDELLGCIVL